jgi:transcriptional regulator with PAS, ATPase and Fis domain
VANGGTLFLDEIGELPKAMQAKMLRFLESGEVRRVGDNEPMTCDVRVVCATNRDLARMVADGEFREDLWFRINTFEIAVPPLRERLEDIPLLALRLAARFGVRETNGAFFAPETLEMLMSHTWPGNVRELANIVEYALILCDQLPILPEHLPQRFSMPAASGNLVAANPTSNAALSLRDREMQAIQESIDRHAGNKTKAAEELGVSLKTLYNKLNQAASLGKTA